jgi:hypothetical protein
MRKASLPPFFWVSYEEKGAEKALNGKSNCSGLVSRKLHSFFSFSLSPFGASANLLIHNFKKQGDYIGAFTFIYLLQAPSLRGKSEKRRTAQNC